MAGLVAEKDFWDGVLPRPAGARRAPRRATTLEETSAIPSLPDEFVAEGRWQPCIVGAWRDGGKIHALEARTTRMALDLAVGDLAQHGKLVFMAGDNLSAILAYEKGRASDLGLLAQCRRAAASCLGAEIRWAHRHIQGVRNPAGYLSRAADRGWLRAGQTWRLGLPGRTQKRSASSVGGGEFCLPHGRPPEPELPRGRPPEMSSWRLQTESERPAQREVTGTSARNPRLGPTEMSSWRLQTDSERPAQR